MITVIEPHADDAFLSVGGHIASWVKKGEAVTIVTVFSGTRKRGTDAALYAKTVGAQWVGLGFSENETRNAEFTIPHTLPCQSGDFILVPLGIGGHPEHYAVRDAVLEAYPAALVRVHFYVDQPYGSKIKNAEELRLATAGKTIASILKPGKAKWRHIPLFKDQAKFFFYNGIESLSNCFELIVE